MKIFITLFFISSFVLACPDEQAKILILKDGIKCSKNALYLKDLLKAKLDFQKKDIYNKIKAPFLKSYYKLSKNSEVKINCNNCNKENEKSYNFQVEFSDTKKRTHRFSLELLPIHKAVVYRAKSSFGVFSENLRASDFYTEEINIERNKNYFTDIKALPYMRLTRTLKENEILTPSHLVPMTLVKSGDLLRVKLYSSGLEIETSAKARKSGSFREKILIQNTQTKKLLQATIVEKGLVEVRL